MGEYIQPFDFHKIFVDYFLGSGELLVFAFIIIFSFASAYFQFSNRLYLTLLTISSIIMAAFLGQAIYILILFVTGFVIFKGISNFVR